MVDIKKRYIENRNAGIVDLFFMFEILNYFNPKNTMHLDVFMEYFPIYFHENSFDILNTLDIKFGLTEVTLDREVKVKEVKFMGFQS